MYSIIILISLFLFLNGWSGSNTIELLFKADLCSSGSLSACWLLTQNLFPRYNLDDVFQIYQRLIQSLFGSCSVMSDFVTHGLQSTSLLCPRDSPGKNTGVACHFLLHEILPTQGLNPGLLHCMQILYSLSQLDLQLGLIYLKYTM